MNKKGIFGILALMVFITSSAAVSAFHGRFLDEDSMENLRTTLDEKEFEEWQEVITSELTEENFEKALERHTRRQGHRENMVEVREAIEAEDYEAYQEAVIEFDMYERELSEDEFEILIQSHKAMQEGDHETARELREELGLFGFNRPDREFGKGRFRN